MLDNFVRPHKWSNTELQEIFLEKVHHFFEIWVMFTFSESVIEMCSMAVPQKNFKNGVFWHFSDLNAKAHTARYPEYAEVQKFF